MTRINTARKRRNALRTRKGPSQIKNVLKRRRKDQIRIKRGPKIRIVSTEMRRRSQRVSTRARHRHLPAKIIRVAGKLLHDL